MSYKLIVADRSPSVQKVVQLAFPSPEFEIFSYGDGQEVIKNLDRINPDAILLSLSLPGKDGYEVGFYLKNTKEFRNTPIVFLKGTFEILDKHKIAVLGHYEIVQKPFDSGKLAQRVKDLIERNQKPSTLPEEPLLEEINSKDFILQQIFNIEKELEEKIRQGILQDLKELVQKELEELKIEISRLKSQS